MRTFKPPGAPLAVAVFSSALVLLVANDWLLKGQGLLPNGLTGKLSDFAGLIVAPVTLAFLLGARSRSAQLGCVALVAVCFTVTEISAAGAALLEALLARVGLVWRLWPDLGDLAALSVLPISWLCCRALSSRSMAQSSPGRLMRWLALPACAACLGSGMSDTFSARAYVYNNTRATAFVEVSSIWLECSDLSAFEHAFLDPDDLHSLGVFELAAGAVFPLNPRELGEPWDASQGECMCPLLRVSAAGRRVNVIVDQTLPLLELVQEPTSGVTQHLDQLVVLHAEAEPIQVGAALRTFELVPPEAQAEPSCALPGLEVLDVGFPPAHEIQRAGNNATAALDPLTLLAVTPIAGNCFELELGEPSSPPAPSNSDAGSDAGLDAGSDAGGSVAYDGRGNTRIQICAPLELFPFQIHDRVLLEWSARNGWNSTDIALETLEIRSGPARFRLIRGLYASDQYDAWQDYQATLPAVRCGPLRDTDGALFEPVEVTYSGQPLVAGQAVRIEGTNQQIYLGRARRQLGRACGTEESWIEVIETWTN
jgi:hypothetical protein